MSKWASFAQGMAVVVERCRARGPAVFHNETGTYVEAPDEIAKMLEVSDIDSVWTPATSWSAAATPSST